MPTAKMPITAQERGTAGLILSLTVPWPPPFCSEPGAPAGLATCSGPIPLRAGDPAIALSLNQVSTPHPSCYRPSSPGTPGYLGSGNVGQLAFLCFDVTALLPPGLLGECSEPSQPGEFRGTRLRHPGPSSRLCRKVGPRPLPGEMEGEPLTSPPGTADSWLAACPPQALGPTCGALLPSLLRQGAPWLVLRDRMSGAWWSPSLQPSSVTHGLSHDLDLLLVGWPQQQGLGEEAK